MELACIRADKQLYVLASYPEGSDLAEVFERYMNCPGSAAISRIRRVEDPPG